MVERALLPPPRLPFLFLALFLLPTVVHADVSTAGGCDSSGKKFCEKDNFAGIANSAGYENEEPYHLEPLLNFHRVKVPSTNKTATAVLNRVILFTDKKDQIKVSFGGGAKGKDKCGLVVVTSSLETRATDKKDKKGFKSYTYNIAVTDKTLNSDGSKIDYQDMGATLTVPTGGDMFTLATYDPQCELIVDIKTFKGVYYVYPRGIFYENFVESRKGEKSEAEFGGGAKTPIFEYPSTIEIEKDNEKIEKMVAHPDSKKHGYFNGYNGMFEKGSKLESVCYDQCRFARKINYEMSRNSQFSMRIIATTQCKWIKIVLNENRTILDTEINLRNSYVIKPTAIRASSLVTRLSEDAKNEITEEINKLTKEEHVAHPSESVPKYTKSKSEAYKPAYEVRVHYQLKQMQAGEKELKFAFHIMDRENTRVSANLVEHPGHVQLYFSSPNCLYTPITSVKGLPGLVNSASRHIRENDNQYTDGEEPTYRIPEKIISDMDEGQAVTVENGNKLVEEKEVEVVPNTNRDVFYEELTNYYQKWQDWKRMKEEEENKPRAWRVWAVAAGYSSGALITFLIASAIACVFRRTLYTFWYKEMYRRYGTDTTDATDIGKTEAGTTIGDTVTGTTVGDTVGDTTGATSTMTTTTTVG